MHLFNKLPDFQRSPSGLEWRLFKKLPRYFLLCIAMPCLIMAWLYFNNATLSPAQLRTIYLCLGIIFSIWFFIGTIAIGCVVVIIMKGPAYVADPYAMPIEDKSFEDKKTNIIDT